MTKLQHRFAKSLHILLVDESHMARGMNMHVLEGLGHSVVEASTGIDGRFMWQALQESLNDSRWFDVIIVSCIAGSLNGAQTILHIREMGYRGIILGINTVIPEADIRYFKSCGVDEIIAKQLTAKNFTTITNEIISQRQCTFNLASLDSNNSDGEMSETEFDHFDVDVAKDVMATEKSHDVEAVGDGNLNVSYHRRQRHIETPPMSANHQYKIMTQSVERRLQRRQNKEFRYKKPVEMSQPQGYQSFSPIDPKMSNMDDDRFETSSVASHDSAYSSSSYSVASKDLYGHISKAQRRRHALLPRVDKHLVRNVPVQFPSYGMKLTKLRPGTVLRKVVGMIDEEAAENTDIYDALLQWGKRCDFSSIEGRASYVASGSQKQKERDCSVDSAKKPCPRIYESTNMKIVIPFSFASTSIATVGQSNAEIPEPPPRARLRPLNDVRSSKKSYGHTGSPSTNTITTSSTSAASISTRSHIMVDAHQPSGKGQAVARQRLGVLPPMPPPSLAGSSGAEGEGALRRVGASAFQQRQSSLHASVSSSAKSTTSLLQFSPIKSIAASCGPAAARSSKM